MPASIKREAVDKLIAPVARKAGLASTYVHMTSATLDEKRTAKCTGAGRQSQ
jgi:hypothetical protein